LAACSAASRCGSRLLAGELKRKHPRHTRPTDAARASAAGK
jgi:hypothetical protein